LATKNKSRNLLEKLTAAETEKEDLIYRLAEEREGAEKAHVEAQAAGAEADAACAEVSLALKRAADAELGLKSLCSYTEKMEASTRARVERAHTLFVDAYHDLGAWTAPFDRSSKEVGLCFLGWLQEELESLSSIMMGLMSYTSLVTYDWPTEDLDRGIFQVEEEVLKRSAGALYDRMWGPHGRDIVRERADRALAQVFLSPSLFFIEIFCCLRR
jgi:hypothetical protein